MEKLFIPILLGSSREGRQSEKAARFVCEEAKLYGKFETQFLGVKDFVETAKTGRAIPTIKNGKNK